MFAYALVLTTVASNHATAATNNTINFQARLEQASGAIVPDGTYNVEFKLYNVSSGGAAEWTEDYTYNSGSGGTDARLRVVNGYLTANLGSITAFPTSIDWTQQQWLTMNIGGTVSSGTITWDGEMNPRLQLTAVPYAFESGELALTSGTNVATLTFTTPTANDSIVLPDASGTVCLQTSSACGFLTGSGAGVELQSATPGMAQHGDFNIDGTGIAGALQAGSLDTASAVALGIGQTTATAVNIGNTTSNILTTINGTALVKPTTGHDSTTAFQVQNASSTDLLNADTSNMRLGVDVTYSAMAAPSGLSCPATCPSSGGSLTAGTYKYEITAIDSAGGETTVSSEVSVTTSGSNLTAGLTWTAVTGASGYKVYRTARNGTSGTEKYLTTVLTNSYSDTGAVTLGTATPPTSNTAYVSTNTSNNNLQLTIGGNGTPTGQLYVGGTVPSAAAGSVTLASTPNGGLAVDGKYAYIGVQAGMEVVDISNPAAPQVLGTVATNAWVNGVSVEGRYAYLAESWNDTLDVIDVSNPANPVMVGQVNVSDAVDSITVSGRYAYIGSDDTSNVHVVDISNPTSPVLLGSVNLNTSVASIYELAASSHYVYASDGAGKLDVIDVSNPKAPTLVDGLTGVIGDNAAPGTGSIYVQGRYAYVTSYWNNALNIIDISNPSSIKLAATLSFGTRNPNQVYVSGRYAYVTDEDNTGATHGVLVVVDVSNPLTPFVVGSLSTPTYNPRPLIISGRYAYLVNNDTSTFSMYDLGGAYLQQLEVGALKAGQADIAGNVQVLGSQSIQGGLAVGGTTTLGGDLGVSGSTQLNGALTVSANNVLQNSPMAYVAQSGTGNASLQFSVPSQNWTIGVDANNSNAFSINSSTATGSPSSTTLGHTSPGASTDGSDNGHLECSVLGSSVLGGTVSSATIKDGSVDGTNRTYDLGLYLDNGTGTFTLVGNTSNGTLAASAGLNTLALTATLIAGKTYWLCADTNGSGTGWSYDNTGPASSYFTYASDPITSGSWPTTITTGTSATFQFVMYVTYTPVPGSFTNALFTIGENGNAKFQNYANSTTALQVQNASGTSILNVDTTNTALSFNGAENGALGAFTTSPNSIPAGVYQDATTAANGYIYALGGSNSSLTVTNTVYYAKLNADGSTGTWQTNSNTLPVASRAAHGASYNGYLYYVGGVNGSGSLNTVYVAKQNKDGSTGAWSATTSLPNTVGDMGVVIANGYMYTVGSRDAPYTNVFYGKINDDGTISSWTSGTSLPTGLWSQLSVAANGYIYSIAGYDGTGTQQATVEYAPLNADGSIGSWSSTTSLPVVMNSVEGGVVNGYVYVVGGNGPGAVAVNTVYYAKLNANGTLGAWSTNANTLPQVNDSPAVVVVNGYIYAVGGGVWSTSAYNTVAYASAARVSISGSLDLVGLTSGSGQLAGQSSSGGSIYAGSIYSQGNLVVQGNTQLQAGLSVNGVLTATGNVLFNDSTNSTTAFQVQNAAGISLLTADSTNKRILIGAGSTGEASPTLLILDSQTGSSTDPIGVNGAMYYNVTSNAFRCDVNSNWQNCTPGLGYTFSTAGGAPGTQTIASAGTILIAPLYMSGQVTVNAMQVDVTTALGATGDVGVYNAAGTLVLDGGSGSLATTTGLQSIVPTQSNKVLEPGQYYVAITWNSTTGAVATNTLPIAGVVPRAGTIAGGGSVLPSSLTLSNITTQAYEPLFTVSN